ncbi:Ser/Thr protein phosphatase [Tritrichomonas foetus]|uniref:Serine/threonine-protein phosphatase n=1 Tax=Tritrichomonas foetus TaxID=1144522 RepID=A0A1J4KUM7_9EUKA|nr:Ser/Thr protein phosphatase [Tritrichomonas foetus]|eukprot:OHT14975.1 Ser/Thr protein phosphatase [Tritrichomonas foetus]
MAAAEAILKAFEPLINKDHDFCLIGINEQLPIPQFSQQLVYDLLDEAVSIFTQQPNLIRLDGNIYIVGDIHGNIRDLIRIIATAKPPPYSRFLFLGDYVDRGEYSLEAICLLLSLFVCYPDHVTLLRGNHEIDSFNSIYGFKEQINALYGSSLLWERFNTVFRFMPISAIVAENTLCVHGGLSPLLKHIKQLETLDRSANPPCELLNDIVWSDPSQVTENCIQSSGGHGCLFGLTFTVQFLLQNNLTRLIRAHECIKNGVKCSKDEKVVTVFSSCNYKHEGSNQCGIIKINKDGDLIAFNLSLIPTLKRSDAVFQKISYGSKQIINSLRMVSPYPSIKRRGSWVQPISGLLTAPKNNYLAAGLMSPHADSTNNNGNKAQLQVRNSLSTGSSFTFRRKSIWQLTVRPETERKKVIFWNADSGEFDDSLPTRKLPPLVSSPPDAEINRSFSSGNMSFVPPQIIPPSNLISCKNK